MVQAFWSQRQEDCHGFRPAWANQSEGLYQTEINSTTAKGEGKRDMTEPLRPRASYSQELMGRDRAGWMLRSEHDRRKTGIGPWR